MSQIKQFLKDHSITEVEAIVPDMAGVARGKVMPAERYAEDEGMRLPESIFLQTVTGEYPEDDSSIHPSEIDIELTGDPKTARVVPWAAEPTAQVIHDCHYGDGRPVPMAPRYVLQRVLDLYTAKGWRPVVAPELEFFLVEPNTDPDYPLKPPVGRSGRPGNRPPGLQHRRGQRVRPAVRRHLRLLRGAGPRHRHADPRGGRGADGDQPEPRRRARPRRPGVPVQAHRARGGAAAQDVRDLHGEAARGRAGQRDAHPPEHRGREDRREHLQRRRGQALGAVRVLHRRPAEIPAARDVAVRAERQQLPAHQARRLGADQRAMGLRQPHRGPARAAVRRRRAGASRTASAARTRTRTSRSRRRSPAATSA